MVSTRRTHTNESPKAPNIDPKKTASGGSQQHAPSSGGGVHGAASTKKRARPNRVAPKPHEGKNVQSRQIAPKGLTKLPVEIFTEIARLLAPGDLISLVRTNKFFRKTLLHRSSIKIWRQAKGNVPGLPRCPPGVCEPEYAALLFSKHCTLRGTSTTARPDPYLYVRLCATCRDTELQELNTKLEDSPSAVIGLVNSTTNCRPKKGRPESRAPRNSVFALKAEVKEVVDRRAVYNRARDRKGLAEWEGLQQRIIAGRRKLSGHLVRYLAQVQESHEDELKNIKENRRVTIIARLKELGWTGEDMTFPVRGRFRTPEDQGFHVLVDTPKLLTDRIWGNILPKLTKILEENRERNNIYNAKKRRIERRQCVNQFLMDMKFNDHPFAPMLDALGVGFPQPPDLSEIYEYGPISYMREALYLEAEDSLEIANPFPKTETVLEWDCLRDLSDTEMTLQDVKTKLGKRKAQIEEKVLEWRAVTENRLLDIFGSSTNITDTTLVINGSTDSTAHLPPRSRFLLRADTLLKRIEPDHKTSWFVSSGDRPPCYYPEFVSASCTILHEAMNPHKFDAEFDPEPETNLDHFARDWETERIVKPLLRDLDMPDVAHIELKLMKDRFVCGRCTDIKPKTWVGLIYHFINALNFWEANKGSKSTHRTRHPIVFRNIHDLEPMDESGPLARLLGEGLLKTHQSESPPPKKPLSSDQLFCYLCEGTGRPVIQLNRADMLSHIQDWHNVQDPVEGIYFGKELHGDLGNKWHQAWDAFHGTGGGVTAGLSTGVP